ncbi:MAG TPA: site-specific DNA-methyltransferase [Candidatus Bathyarchaeia archaeon]|nr:site-specific DNA-methyltransferase [Candidatus Bathyarchaeia archaeon]
MVTKTLKKMEVELGFVHIPAKNRAELMGDLSVPFDTKLNDLPAKVDKYGRLWSDYLRDRFSVNTEVTLTRNENGFQVTANGQKQKPAISENIQTAEDAQVSSSVPTASAAFVNKLVFGSSVNMHELADKSVSLVVTSPPYFNAPFDYPDLFDTYDEFLKMIRGVAKELKRVMAEGRIACFVCDDTLINGSKFPVVADITKIFIDEGFKYRDRITWVKPEGYIRISRRSGVLIQHPYPMYFYPDNLQESILIFQNGTFDYSTIPNEIRRESKIDMEEWSKRKWYLSVWNITNVLPFSNRIEKGIAAFPDEIAYRLIKLFSYKGETVLDPFMGSGTTLKVALELNRNVAGYDIDIELLETIKEKTGIGKQVRLCGSNKFNITVREDAKHLRTELQRRVARIAKSK